MQLPCMPVPPSSSYRLLSFVLSLSGRMRKAPRTSCRQSCRRLCINGNGHVPYIFSLLICNCKYSKCGSLYCYIFLSVPKEIALKRSHLWFIFMTSCMIGGFTYLFYHLVNIFFHPAATVDDPAFTDTFFSSLLSNLY